jgi:hypothetical protein
MHAGATAPRPPGAIAASVSAGARSTASSSVLPTSAPFETNANVCVAHRAGHHLDRDRVRIARRRERDRVDKRCAIVVRWREVGHERPDTARH